MVFITVIIKAIKRYDTRKKLHNAYANCSRSARWEKNYLKLEAGTSFMPLTIEILHGFRIAMAHNYKQNGDILCDPDMEIEVNRKNQTIHAKTYQLDSLNVYQTVEREDGSIDHSLSKELDQFLNTWLNNILEQGYVQNEHIELNDMKENYMATRSYIGKRLDDVTCELIYCHSDGYIDGVGATLQKHYRSNEAVEDLINAGYLSQLADDIELSIEIAKSVSNGETSHIKRIADLLEDDFKSEGIEYVYLWNGIFWQVLSVYNDNKFLMLQPLIDKNKKGKINEES